MNILPSLVFACSIAIALKSYSQDANILAASDKHLFPVISKSLNPLEREMKVEPSFTIQYQPTNDIIFTRPQDKWSIAKDGNDAGRRMEVISDHLYFAVCINRFGDLPQDLKTNAFVEDRFRELVSFNHIFSNGLRTVRVVKLARGKGDILVRESRYICFDDDSGVEVTLQIRSFPFQHTTADKFHEAIVSQYPIYNATFEAVIEQRPMPK